MCDINVIWNSVKQTIKMDTYTYTLLELPGNKTVTKTDWFCRNPYSHIMEMAHLTYICVHQCLETASDDTGKIKSLECVYLLYEY